MKLRPYQEEAVRYAVDMLRSRGNSLIVAGTGAGKTIMMAAAIGNFFRGFKAEHGRNPHILVLVHRTEIHGQNHKKFSLVNPDIACSEITSTIKSLKGYVHFGMMQTVCNVMKDFKQSGIFFDLIVIDEAHHAAADGYESIVNTNKELNPTAALLGVTATPNRGDELPLIHLFDNYYQVTTTFLINSHYLVRPTFIDLSPVFNVGDKLEKGHLAKNCKNDIPGTSMINQMCSEFKARKEPGKSIIFAPNHEFCGRIYNSLINKGIKVAYLSAEIDDSTRKSEIERFETGDAEALINVDICTEGYDFPELRNIIDFDTNGTHGQWVQKVGRVLRTAPEKTSCTVIDFGGNIDLYPGGIETTVNLEGAYKSEKGGHLRSGDFFRKNDESTESADVVYSENAEYTPYHLPPGVESINDNDLGVAYASCGNVCDFIVIKTKDGYSLFAGNKSNMSYVKSDSFDSCINDGLELIGDIAVDDRPISGMQIKLLAPEYPTVTLTRHGANCCICWKTWKKSIMEAIG